MGGSADDIAQLPDAGLLPRLQKRPAAREGARYSIDPAYVRAALAGRGLYEAPPNTKPDVIVELECGMAAPQILGALGAARRERPGQTLSVEALLGAGWPGETVLSEAGASRVYVAVSTLRRMGLRDVLRRVDDGYLIDPEVPLVAHDEA